MRYNRYTQFILVFVFAVILAGGVVRTTQSGMGCPDWPHCFGRWIPPVNKSQLPPDYEKYLDKQDIDHTFNAFHTWVEYINRLLGALLGVFVFIHAIWSFRKFYKTNRNVCWLSLLLLLSTGFQGWLGKKVVDANLEVVKITIHMLVALAIAIIPATILCLLQKEPKINDGQLKWLLNTSVIVLLLQIIAGTDVREQIDEISKMLHYQQRDLWIMKLDGIFALHKAFAAAVALLSFGIFFRSLSYKPLRKNATWLFVSLILVITAGMILSYFNIPAFVQPIHLLSSSILFVVLFVFRLRIS